MLLLNIEILNSRKKRKKTSRSHVGGSGCHCDETHFKIADPCNLYPS